MCKQAIVTEQALLDLGCSGHAQNDGVALTQCLGTGGLYRPGREQVGDAVAVVVHRQ